MLFQFLQGNLRKNTKEVIVFALEKHRHGKKKSHVFFLSSKILMKVDRQVATHLKQEVAQLSQMMIKIFLPLFYCFNSRTGFQ